MISPHDISLLVKFSLLHAYTTQFPFHIPTDSEIGIDSINDTVSYKD